jgi:transposase-like protein
MAKKREKYVYHDLDFKKKLVMLYLEGNGSYRELSREFGLKSETQLIDWVKKYKNGDLTEENSDRRGKCTFKKKKFKNTDEEKEYLKFENEYLKKKLLLLGETESFIANLWSSKNLK